MALNYIENKFKRIEEEEKKINDYYNFKSNSKKKHVWANELKEKIPEEIRNFNKPYLNIKHEIYFTKKKNKEDKNFFIDFNKNRENLNKKTKNLNYLKKGIFSSNKNNKISLVNDILNYSNYNNEVKFWHKNCKNFSIKTKNLNLLPFKNEYNSNQFYEEKNKELKKIENNFKKCINRSYTNLNKDNSFKIKQISLKKVNFNKKIENKTINDTMRKITIDNDLWERSKNETKLLKIQFNKEINKIKNEFLKLNNDERIKILENLKNKLKEEPNVYFNNDIILLSNSLIEIFNKKSKFWYFKLFDIKENLVYKFKWSKFKKKLILNNNRNTNIFNLNEILIDLKLKNTFINYIEIYDNNNNFIESKFINLGNPFTYNLKKIIFKIFRFILFIFGYNPNKYSKLIIENNKILKSFTRYNIYIELNKNTKISYIIKDIFHNYNINLDNKKNGLKEKFLKNKNQKFDLNKFFKMKLNKNE